MDLHTVTEPAILDGLRGYFFDYANVKSIFKIRKAGRLYRDGKIRLPWTIRPQRVRRMTTNGGFVYLMLDHSVIRLQHAGGGASLYTPGHNVMHFKSFRDMDMARHVNVTDVHNIRF